MPEVDIRLHRKIYSLAAVHQAIRDFKPFAHCDLRQKGAYYLVRMSNFKTENEPEVKGNFLNYVLMLSRMQ